MSISNNRTELSTMLDAYKQAGGWADGSVLVRHERESDKGYQRRKNSFCAPALYTHLINTYDVLWGHAPLRVDAPQPYDAFLEDCGAGQTLSGFLSRALKAALVQGSSWLVMDSQEEQPASLEEMYAQRAYPFLELVHAHQVTDLVVDRIGRIKKFAYTYNELGGDGETHTYTRTIVGGMSHVSDAQGVQIGVPVVLPVAMPVIPVVPTGEPLVSGALPESPTRSLYQGHRTVASTNSLIDESLYSQQYSILVVTGTDNLSDVVLGASNALKLNEGSNATFIAPSGTPIDLMLKRIESAVSFMTKTFASLLTGDQAQSGVAKVLDRQSGALQLRGMALFMQDVEYQIFNMFQSFMRQPVSSTYTVTYYSDFDLVDIASYVSAVASVLGMEGLGAEAKLAIRRDVLRKVLSGMDPLELQEVVAKETAGVAAVTPIVDPQQTEMNLA